MKKLPDFDGYFIDKHGCVYSNKSGRLKKLTPRKRYDSYYHVKLRRNNKDCMVLIHRALAATFLGGWKHKMEVNHIDGNRDNNSISNLEWVTRSENMKHKFTTGLDSNVGTRNPRCILGEEDVLEIRKSTLNRNELAKKYGVSWSAITSILKRKTWKHL